MLSGDGGEEPLQLETGNTDALAALAAASWRLHVATCDLKVGPGCTLHPRSCSLGA